MKKVILLSAIASAFVLDSCGNSSGDKGQTTAADTTKMKTGDAYYQCEMHLDQISVKPGRCSKCGMDLVKVEKK